MLPLSRGLYRQQNICLRQTCISPKCNRTRLILHFDNPSSICCMPPYELRLQACLCSGTVRHPRCLHNIFAEDFSALFATEVTRNGHTCSLLYQRVQHCRHLLLAPVLPPPPEIFATTVPVIFKKSHTPARPTTKPAHKNIDSPHYKTYTHNLEAYTPFREDCSRLKCKKKKNDTQNATA